MSDKTGQQIGNYRLVKLLGTGSFGDVYLGQHVHLTTKLAAIKILHLSNVDVKKFQQEAETTEKLVHPHIVRLLDFTLEQGTPSLVLDFAPGGSLRARHPKGSQVPLDTVVAYLKEIASALQYAHDQHILHRDIKPDNILVGRQGELLLSDFGIAVLSQTGRTTMQKYNVGGTPFYMAPEQFESKPEKASDQYALAVVVYELLCGTVPFSGGSFIQLGYQHTHNPVPPLRDHLPTLPALVEEVVMTALAKDPRRRFGSVQTFAHALEQAYKDELEQVRKVEEERTRKAQEAIERARKAQEEEAVRKAEEERAQTLASHGEQIIYLSPEEERATVRERLERAQAQRIILIIPPQTQLRSQVGWRLLHARARELGKDVVVISSDRQIRAVVKASGFRVAESQESLRSGGTRPGSRPGRTRASGRTGNRPRSSPGRYTPNDRGSSNDIRIRQQHPDTVPSTRNTSDPFSLMEDRQSVRLPEQRGAASIDEGWGIESPRTYGMRPRGIRQDILPGEVENEDALPPIQELLPSPLRPSPTLPIRAKPVDNHSLAVQPSVSPRAPRSRILPAGSRPTGRGTPAASTPPRTTRRAGKGVGAGRPPTVAQPGGGGVEHPHRKNKGWFWTLAIFLLTWLFCFYIVLPDTWSILIRVISALIVSALVAFALRKIFDLE